MSTAYEVLYENLLPKFRSYRIPLMTVSEVKEHLHDFLIPAISRFHVCRNDLKNRDDDLEEFSSDLSDTEIEILSNYMLLEYINSTYIRTPDLLRVNLTSSDFHAFSNANHLDSLMSMQKYYLSENETLLSRYAWMDAAMNGTKLSKKYRRFD